MDGSSLSLGLRRAGLAFSLAVASVVALPPGGFAEACATGHLGVRWSDFPREIGDFGPLFFYYTEEKTGPVTLKIRSVGDDCSQLRQPVTATYRVSDPPPGTPRSATSVGPPPDYQSTSGTTQPLWDHNGGAQEEAIQVQVLQDPLVEPVAERVQATITSSSGRIEAPWDVPLYIVDDEPPSRVALKGAGPYEWTEIRGVAQVPVFRAGPATESESFGYSVEGSSSSPATEGADYRVTSPQPLTFDAGERMKLITLELLRDGIPEPPEEVTVTLTDAVADDPRSAAVRIVDQAGKAGPESRLHHPNHRKRYRADNYKIREIHVFTRDHGGGGVIAAEFALRRNMKGGKCAWWNGRRFVRGACGGHRWLDTRQYEPDFFYYRLKLLEPTKRKVRSYTAYSRAIDSAGIVEATLGKGRNANTFKVKPPKKR